MFLSKCKIVDLKAMKKDELFIITENYNNSQAKF